MEQSFALKIFFSCSLGGGGRYLQFPCKLQLQRFQMAAIWNLGNRRNTVSRVLFNTSAKDLWYKQEPYFRGSVNRGFQNSGDLWYFATLKISRNEILLKKMRSLGKALWMCAYIYIYIYIINTLFLQIGVSMSSLFSGTDRISLR